MHWSVKESMLRSIFTPSREALITALKAPASERRLAFVWDLSCLRVITIPFSNVLLFTLIRAGDGRYSGAPALHPAVAFHASDESRRSNEKTVCTHLFRRDMQLPLMVMSIYQLSGREANSR